MIFRDDPVHLRLLEHDLGHQDGIRVSDAAPGEDAAVPVVPLEQHGSVWAHPFDHLGHVGLASHATLALRHDG